MDQTDSRSTNPPQSVLWSVMSMIDRRTSEVVKVIAALASVMLGGIALFVTFAVASRYFGAPILGSVDIVKYLMLGLVVLSLSYAEDQRAHVRVDIVTSRLPKVAQKICEMFAVFCTVFAAGAVAFVFYQSFMSSTSAGNTSTGSIAIPVKPFQFLVLLGFLAWTISAATELLPSRKRPPTEALGK